MDRLRKCYSHLVGGSFLAGKAAWALSRCMKTESADYCMLVDVVKVTSLLAKACSGLRFSFGVRAWKMKLSYRKLTILEEIIC